MRYCTLQSPRSGRGRFSMASTTSQFSWKPRSSTGAPIVRRTRERAPSHPTTANEGACAVASHDGARAALRQGAGREILGAHHDGVRLLIKGEDLGAVADRNRRKAREPIAQHALELRLVETVAGVPGLRPALLRTRPVEQQAAAVADEFHARRDVDKRLDRFGETDGLHEPHDLVVEVHRARQMVDGRLPVQHEGLHALQPEKVGEHRADGPAADDGDLELVRFARLARRRSTWASPPRRVGPAVATDLRALRVKRKAFLRCVHVADTRPRGPSRSDLSAADSRCCRPSTSMAAPPRSRWLVRPASRGRPCPAVADDAG